MTGRVASCVSYDCVRDELFYVEHERYPLMWVACNECDPTIYRQRWKEKVAHGTGLPI